MGSDMIALHVLHILWTLSSVTSQEWPIQRSCGPCRCSLQSMCSYGTVKYVDCSGRRLVNLPTNLPKDLDVLDLSYNKLDKTSLHSVCDFEFLQHLSLAFNPFTSIERSTFLKCSLLIELIFTGSSALCLNSGSFVGLDNVRVIYGLRAEFMEHGVFEHLSSLKSLEFTFIGTPIPEDIFTGLQVEVLNLTLYNVTHVPQRLFEFGDKTLQSLHLSGPEVTYVHEDFLRGLIVLKHVSLDLPDLASLPERLFRKLSSVTSADDPQGLHTIFLKGMDRLPRKLFDNMEGLMNLDIHGVHDVAVDDLFADLVNLEVLNLTDSTVVTVPRRWFARLYSLKTLDISSTNLGVLEKDTFRGLINLRDLNLSSNGLRILPQQTFEPLSRFIRTLRIKSNMLKDLDEGVLNNMLSLQYLDISDNKLSQISPNAFVDLKLLTNLQLQENKLNFLPKNLLRNQHKLQILNLSHNHFTRVPLAAGGFTNFLRFLYLSNNKITTVLPSLHNSLPYLKYFALMNNPIYCQCQIFSLRLHRRSMYIDAFCESPQRYSRRHVMYITIPAMCPGPRPEPGEEPQFHYKKATPYLLKSNDDYDYDEADYNNPLTPQIGNGTVKGDRSKSIDVSFTKKGCHLMQLLGSFAVKVKSEPPLLTSVLIPLPTVAISQGIVTSGEVNIESDAITSTSVLHVSSVVTDHGQHIPGVNQAKVIEKLKISNGKIEDVNVMQKSSSTDPSTFIYLTLPLVLLCFVGLGVWWKTKGANRSAYEVNSQNMISVECSLATDIVNASRTSQQVDCSLAEDIINASRTSQHMERSLDEGIVNTSRTSQHMQRSLDKDIVNTSSTSQYVGYSFAEDMVNASHTSQEEADSATASSDGDQSTR